MAAGSLLTSFLGAVQAALSVLLTVFSGVVAAQVGLLDAHSAKHISSTCVRLFLPALLITNIGKELHAETGARYVPILVWSLIYVSASLALGHLSTRLARFPSWVTAALAFNNTTAFPLLLLQSLEAAGILDTLLASSSDTAAAAVARARSYFLVCAVVNDGLTFSLDARLLEGDEAPHGKQKEEEEENEEETAEEGDQQRGGEQADEQTSLLPAPVVHGAMAARRKVQPAAERRWRRLPPRARTLLEILYGFVNAPLIGAVIGAVLGLVPPLHRAFFNGPDEGGVFNAWLTASLKNVGELFVALQVVVVGVKLSSCLIKMKKGEDSGRVPWQAMLFILTVRFVVWPAVSIGVVYLVASRTAWLSDDPVLWFTLMLMPTGPPAMKLTALADVTGCAEEEKLSIAKFLTISYMASPLIAFTVVGALKASQVVAAGRGG